MPTVDIKGSGQFRALEVALQTNERFFVEPGTTVGMCTALKCTLQFAGSAFSSAFGYYLGNESRYINEFSNEGSDPQKLVLASRRAGDICELTLDSQEIVIEPGAYLASTDGVAFGVRNIGLSSLIGGGGLYKRIVKGSGKVWLGAMGAAIEKEVDGRLAVSCEHLLAFDATLKLETKVLGGLVAGFLSGSGIEIALVGQGRVFLQSRSELGLAKYLANHQ